MIFQRFKPSLEQIEAMGRRIGIMGGASISPSWPMAKAAFEPYIELDSILHQGFDVSSLTQMLAALNALTSQILLGHIFPSLLGCLVICMIFLFLCGWIGQTLTRYFIRGCLLTIGANRA